MQEPCEVWSEYKVAESLERDCDVNGDDCLIWFSMLVNDQLLGMFRCSELGWIEERIVVI
jgi:hypothetical protein